MNYLYYPGCSLEGTAREYDLSTRALMNALDIRLTDVTGWTCCGATAAESTGHLISLALPARNLALAEAMDASAEIMVPCSACYLNLKRTEEASRQSPEDHARVNAVLAEEELKFRGVVRSRHLLDVLANHVGAERIAACRRISLEGLIIAPYYGCQCLRPYAEFDDPEQPVSMPPLVNATGARVLPWEMGGKCCGASHMNTKPDVALTLVGAILKAARGADAVVTVCPMCQMNLEGYQRKISGREGVNLKMTVLYLPQLLGLALGLSEQELGLHLNLSVTKTFRNKVRSLRAAGLPVSQPVGVPETG